MFVIALGLGLTTVLLAMAGYKSGNGAPTLGSMSGQWMAAHQASQPAPSN